MNEPHFINLHMFLLLWLLPALTLLFLYGAYRRRQAMAAFTDPALSGRQGGRRPRAKNTRRAGRFLLFCLGIICLIIALARPAWNLRETEVKQTGRDLVFLLDVSKSMLAADLMPSRLERAKLAIRDCVEKLQGDRIALVAFAGSATVKCPLTQDYGFFLMMLDGIDTTSTEMGGTLVGDALRACVKEVFDQQEKAYKDIILITDGEDHDSYPVQAAKQTGEAGIRLLVVGIGDDQEGRRIPVTTAEGKASFLRYNGREVWSKLDGATLRRMAEATPGGRYLPVATGDVDLGQIYLDLIATADRKELGSKNLKRYDEKFQIFVAAALILFAAEGMLGRVLVIGALTLLPLLPPAPCAASTRDGLLASGNEAYNQGKFSEAQKYYDQALAAHPDDATLQFNRGDSCYRQGKFSEAEAAFGRAVGLGKDKEMLARSWFNRGNARFRRALQQSSPEAQLAGFKEGLSCYEQALQLDKQLAGAGRNLEICRRKIRELERAVNQQTKPQPEQKQQGTAPQAQPQNEGQDRSAAKQGEPRQDDQQTPGSGEQQKPQQQKQAGAGSEQKKEQRETAGQQQNPAADQAMNQPQSGADPSGAAPRPAESGANNRDREPAAQTVESILAAEKQRAEMLRQRRQTAPASVEKDW